MFGVFVAMSVWVLALGLWWNLTRARVWTGVDGVYVQDVTQYLAWIQDASRHVLVSDLFVLRGTPHDYLQPAIVISGGLVAIGVPSWLALLLWQPVALGGVFCGSRALIHHQLPGRVARRFALPLALLGGSIGTFQDRWLPWWTWGYVFGTLSLAAMLASLLSYEHASRRDASVWPSALLAGLSSWLHPWSPSTSPPSSPPRPKDSPAPPSPMSAGAPPCSASSKPCTAPMCPRTSPSRSTISTPR